MRCSVAFAVVAAALAACGDTAIVVEVRSDGLAVPTDVDAFCLAVADTSSSGGEFARVYGFADELTELPQTLTVEPGGADRAELSVRGYKTGVEVARDLAVESFGGVTEVSLTLRACPLGSDGAPSLVGGTGVPAGTRAAASFGRGGTRVVAVGPDLSAVFVAGDAGMDDAGVTAPAVSATDGPRQLLSFDADGDCDDDILVVPAASEPELWRRESDGAFSLVEGALPGAIVGIATAAAAADVDGDLDIDLAVGRTDELIILLNDGSGSFTPHVTATPDEAANDVTALAFGDLDDDGDADLIVGRGETVAQPARALFNTGNGEMQFVPAALPEVPLLARSIVVRDIDGDGARDLLLASSNDSVRLYVNRTDGRLEDRSFVALPSQDPIEPSTVTAGDWDGDCRVDVLVGLADGSPALSWPGSDVGSLTEESFDDPASSQITLVDVDDDGASDALLVDGAAGLSWVRR